MFTVRMIQLIETHAEKLSEELLDRLQRSGSCRDLISKVPPEELRSRTHEIYRNLSQWLLEKTQAEIEERYVRLGLRRRAQGVPLSELLYALSTTKECLWEHLEQDALLEDPLELIGNLNLLRAVGRFFDRASHAAAVGYEAPPLKAEHHPPAWVRAS
jgi:hypothetical protein